MLRIFTGLLVLLLFTASPARAEWRRAESSNFVLYGNLSEAQLRQRILLLEDFDRLLRSITTAEEPPAENKLHIYVVYGRDDLNVIRTLPPGVAGLYTATPEGIAAFVDDSQESGNFILFHEYAHHFMLQNVQNAYPAWYIEGFAEYFSTVRFTPRKIDIGNFDDGRAYAIMQQRWLPMERILSGGPMGLSREDMSVYYAQSWLLTHYFFSSPERYAALLRLLVALRSASPEEALRAATGFTFAQLNDELRRYIRAGRISYRQMDRASNAAAPAVSITSLPRSAGDMILFEALLRVGIGENDVAAALPRIRAAAARHADDPLAMRVLAHAEIVYGNSAAGERLVDRLLTQAPNDAQLLYLKGMRYLKLAESDDPPANAGRTARTFFTRAHRADPNHFQTLYRFAQSLRGEPAFLSENTRNVMLLARQLAPQVSEITMNAAALLMSRREYAEAIAYLAPLAANPHEPGLAEAARRMIAEARARQQAPAGAADEDADPPAGG
ncbi:MAG TPA: hypothetical protein VLK25_09550 [Allosphingosinicella sp.]|nr:hypothetical protein [Allosphingosinicella sp.]